MFACPEEEESLNLHGYPIHRYNADPTFTDMFSVSKGI